MPQRANAHSSPTSISTPEPSSRINSNTRFWESLAFRLGRRAPAGPTRGSNGGTHCWKLVSLSRSYINSAASSLVRIRLLTSICSKTADAARFDSVDRTVPVNDLTGVESKKL